MKNLAIIPARSGSKGLIDKNIKMLNGKPLMSYSIEAALQSNMFENVMVSTDSEKYAEIALNIGAEVPFLRSKQNSSDTASSWDTVREVLHMYDKDFDTVCLLQPTSPLRNSNDIVAAYNLYDEKQANTVISVCETDHSPLWENVIPENGSLDAFLKTDGISQRQKLAKYYRINGAIYIVNCRYILNHDNIYENSFAYKMQRDRSIDIDEEVDFLFARILLDKNLK